MTFELDAGMASAYMTTDPDRGVAIMSNPALLVVRCPLRGDHLAGFLSFLHRDPSEKARMATMVSDLVRDPANAPAAVAAVAAPLLVLANGFEPNTLFVLKFIKLRGLGQTLAVDLAQLPADPNRVIEPLFRLAASTGGYGHPDKSCAGVDRVANLAAVSGRRKTVLAVGDSADQILAAYPDLATGPMGDVQEPLY